MTIDMLWGAPALAAMNAAARFACHVEVGNMATPEITLPAPLIRSTSLDVRGFSVAHAWERQRQAAGGGRPEDGPGSVIRPEGAQ